MPSVRRDIGDGTPVARTPWLRPEPDQFYTDDTPQARAQASTHFLFDAGPDGTGGLQVESSGRSLGLSSTSKVHKGRYVCKTSYVPIDTKLKGNADDARRTAPSV